MLPTFTFSGTNAANHSKYFTLKHLSDLHTFSNGHTDSDNDTPYPALSKLQPAGMKNQISAINDQKTIPHNTPSKVITSRFFWIMSIFTILIIFTANVEANAASVTFEWDPISQSIDGYRLFMRTEGKHYDYKKPIWEGTATTCTIKDLKNGVAYYFVARAFKGKEESNNSPEVRFFAPVLHPPSASAGDDQIALAASMVTLDGAASADPDGNQLSFDWIQTTGNNVSLINPNAAKTSFTAPNVSNPATLTFELTVVDADSLSATDTCQVTVYPAGTADSDGDGLTNVAEITIHGTDPSNPDTDGDGVTDADEIDAGTDPTSAPLTKIWIEAEEGDIHFPMQISGAESASADAFIEVKEGSLDKNGSARYTFKVQYPGEYLIWGRVIANNLTSDSFFVSIDNGPELVWHTPLGGKDKWTWDVISKRLALDPRDKSNPFVFNFSTGIHTLTIKQREDGTRLDKLLITNDKTYVPKGLGDQSEPTTEKIWIEAETGTLSAPMRIDNDAEASAGKYISIPEGNGATVDPQLPAGDATYNFTVTDSGNYVIWGRIIAVNGKSDSFYVAVDDEAFLIWHTTVNKQAEWIWDVVTKRKVGDKRNSATPLLYYLEKGSHTLTLKHREDGVKIDKILITDNLTMQPKDKGDQVDQTEELIWIEAEAGNLFAPMQIDDHAKASGGAHIVIPQEAGRLSDPSLDGGYAEYHFDLQRNGEFVIWGRVMAINGKRDSFYLSVDDQDFFEWHTKVDKKKNWVWDIVSQRHVGAKRDNTNPLIYQLESGTHTLRIKHRESGTMLDQLLITNDLTYSLP